MSLWFSKIYICPHDIENVSAMAIYLFSRPSIVLYGTKRVCGLSRTFNADSAIKADFMRCELSLEPPISRTCRLKACESKVARLQQVT